MDHLPRALIGSRPALSLLARHDRLAALSRGRFRSEPPHRRPTGGYGTRQWYLTDIRLTLTFTVAMATFPSFVASAKSCFDDTRRISSQLASPPTMAFVHGNFEPWEVQL